MSATVTNLSTTEIVPIDAPSLSAAITSVRRKRFLWAWPIAAIPLLAFIAWATQRAVEAEVRRGLREDLTTILNADVKALRLWLGVQQGYAADFATDETVVAALRELRDREPSALLLQPALERIRKVVKPRLAALNADDFVLIDRAGRVLAVGDNSNIGTTLEGYRKEFFDRVIRDGPSVSRPFRSAVLLPDSTGAMRTGLPTMIAAAPMADGGLFGLRLRPGGEMTRILQIARAGESGEAYLLSRDGLFLTESRFDDQLRQLGLIPDLPDSDSMLTLESRNPGVDLRVKRPFVKRSEQPLTVSAAGVASGQPGNDVAGYPDYRGVPTVGAWTWLPEYEFGVVAEQDYAEAYRPLWVLRQILYWLLGLLALAAVAVFLALLAVARYQRVAKRATLYVQQLGQYVLEERIGAGGMGTVFKAKHQLLRRPTAVKMLNPDRCTPAGVARFEREVQLTSRLTHPNTVAVFDFGRTPEGTFYYAMEYLDGVTLQQLVTQHGPLPEGRVIAILRQICGSLAEAHALGLIHRDIKPSNVLLSIRGGIADFVTVVDFGLAKLIDDDEKLSQAGALIGTPQYASPEAISRPSEVEARSDLYGVGAVGYFLLTGTPVFRGNTVEVCRLHVDAVPESPSARLGRPVGPKLEALLMSCLSKAVIDRPFGAKQMIEELDQCEAAGSWTAADADDWWLRMKPGLLDSSIASRTAATEVAPIRAT